MYGKIFDSIYDGTLYGNWEAIATFQQFIVLANADGIVDMTPQAIAARTSFPLDLIQRGIKFLEAPDPYSRTPGDEGRRIELIDPDNRPWGWRIINHGKYKRLRNMAEKREADRDRIAEKRRKNKDVASESQNVANVAHADADAKNKTNPPDGGSTVWDFGKSLLAEQGLSTKSAGALIGSWLREWPEAEVAEALRAAAGKADVRSYVAAVLKAKPKKSSGGPAGLRVAMP